MRLLLIEDSRRLQASIARGMQKSGYAIDVSGDGDEGLWLAESNRYDTIILDLMLPGLDGLTILRRLRRQEDATPVLILTARDGVEDRVRGLDLGADDYLVKPFAFDELLARVRALCRRRYDRANTILIFDDLQIDTAARTVTRGGRSIDLTPREFRLLEYLSMRRGQVISRSEIEAHVYADSIDLASNVVDSTVCSLRRKLGGPTDHPLIHTRRGVGYMLDDVP